MTDDEFDRIVARNADDFHEFALQGLRRSRTKMLVWSAITVVVLAVAATLGLVRFGWPALLVLGVAVVVAVAYGIKTWKP